MKVKNKFIAMVLVACMMLGALAGCSGDTAAVTEDGLNAVENATQTTGDTYKVAAIMMFLGSDFWNMLEEGLQLGAYEAGCTIDVMAPASESDAIGQVGMIEDCLTKGYDAIIVSPIDSSAVAPVLQQAEADGVKVITVNSDVAADSTSLRETFVGISNYDAGAVLGEYLIEKGDAVEGTQVGILRGLLGIEAHDDRVNGLKDTLEAAGCNVVSVQAADSDRGKAVSTTENMLETYPDIEILYCTNDEMALGAYQVIQSRKSNAKVIGFDGSNDALSSVKNGELYATVAQLTLEMGRQAVVSTVDILNGQSVEQATLVECKIIDQENAAAFMDEVSAERAKAQGL